MVDSTLFHLLRKRRDAELVSPKNRWRYLIATVIIRVHHPRTGLTVLAKPENSVALRFPAIVRAKVVGELQTLRAPPPPVRAPHLRRHEDEMGTKTAAAGAKARVRMHAR
jgi:hypothetical protein